MGKGYVSVSYSRLEELLGLPPGARISRCETLDPYGVGDLLHIVFEHPDIPPKQEGEYLPRLSLTFTIDQDGGIDAVVFDEKGNNIIGPYPYRKAIREVARKAADRAVLEVIKKALEVSLYDPEQPNPYDMPIT